MMSSPDYINWPTNGPYFDAQHPLAQGCIGAWCFNPNWWNALTLYDLSRHEGPGLLNGFTLPTNWRPTGLLYDALATYVRVDNVDKFLFGTSSSWSMEGWVRVVPDAVIRNIVRLDAQDIANRDLWGLRKDAANKVNLLFGDVGGTLGNLTSVTALASGLHHVIGTVTPATLCIYIDGKLNATGANNATVWNTTRSLLGLGCAVWITDGIVKKKEIWNSTVAKVAIYNRAITPGEVTQLAADPFLLFRRKEIAYFFGLGPSYIPYPFSRGARGGLHALTGGNAA